MKKIGNRVLVTGGASFIGSHLVDKLLSSGKEVIVADDLSSGRLDNFERKLKRRSRGLLSSGRLTVRVGDLKDRAFAKNSMRGVDTVFHLAAAHGGRGYIASHPVECSTNMMLDQIVFEEAFKAGVDRLCFASSACVYPSYLQEETGSQHLLREDEADPFVRDKALADLEYGWAKLMGEMTLKAYHRQHGMKTSSVRIFTAYGPRENETHAIIALVAKAFIKMDPYVIWGTGQQDRNFTYVEDIVDALVLASQKIEDGSPVNAGREDRITIDQACDLVFQITGWRPRQIKRDTTKPQGVASRAADLTMAKKLLGWMPRVSYDEGFKRTVDWYFTHKNLGVVRANLDRLLMER